MSESAENKIERPLVTFALFAYNQEEYIKEAVEGAFSQTYEPMEIILSDDCSGDNTYEIMKELAGKYEGPHKIILNRNKSNLGLIGHVNFISKSSCGVIIVAAAGDDISLPSRTSEHVAAYIRSPKKIYLAHSSANKFSNEKKALGLWSPSILDTDGSKITLAKNFNGVIGGTASWRRELFFIYGPIKEINTYEDLILTFRAVILEGVVYINKPLVNYRVGTGITADKFSSKLREKEVKRKIKDEIFIACTLKQRRRDSIKVRQIVLTLFINIKILETYLRIGALLILNYFAQLKKWLAGREGN